MTRIALYLAFFPQTHNHSIILRKTLDKAKLRNILKIIHSHEKQGKTEKSRGDMTTKWILEQTKRTVGKPLNL